ncbi:MAG: phospholipid carrier-dependent glycosyltransferase, partial [Nitrospinaceae bacterium]|nr:glycosyltransferase family 39 protein [Nitrospinaceae bacterium]NIR54684.1 glycosyltransferase family 39 protein [Nitrospinaceae bacterium]NIS85101.1 glycosyltransferase family 39 protein [Nitrospinaceae bacterium]NIT81918.1 glycosyltransferase family 39 protein [Nitrospinaceae bacterium]NIU44182.1 glycosyltransferase family 39 protein [Nitrospinaceae bacterium]
MNTASAASTVRFRETVLLLLILVLAFAAFSYRLGEIPPYHNDENFYVESARHMVESGDYLTPVYHEKKRFAKPPLFYWLVSLAYKTFGVQLASARGVSAVFGTLCIAVTFFLARRLFGREAALVSAFLLPGMVLHFQISRWAITDMTLNFFILLAFYFFVRGYQEEKTRPRDFLLFYGAIALGFLTKGPPALVIPGLTLALFLLLRRDGALVRQLRLGTGALIVIAVNLPWFALMFHLHGDAFKDHILGAEIRDRIVHDTPFSGYYVG